MRRLVSITYSILIAAAFLICACRPENVEKRRAEIIMATEVEVVARGNNPQALETSIDNAFKTMRELEKKMSRFDPDSELSNINAKAGAGEIKISREMSDVLKAADSVNKLSGGAFDPTIGPAMKLWSRIGNRMPSEEELRTLRKVVGWKLVKFNASRGTVSLEKGMSLDLDGVGKGYIAGRALDTLRRAGVLSALVNAGGDMTCYSSGRNNWSVGISNPVMASKKPIIILKLRNGALATSGGTWRFWQIGNKKYPRILDPRTLQPPPDAPLSASAFDEDAAVADAWATAAILLGSEIVNIKGKDVPALMILNPNGAMIFNDRWKELFGVPAASP